ncbi:MAG TPA: sensor histidine kinase [Streptosporangiaceae bacterium]|nr:sensor histidine kinase [Streptosporangiaceae bacterium]
MPALPVAPSSARRAVRAWASPARHQEPAVGGLRPGWPVPGSRWPVAGPRWLSAALRTCGLGVLLYLVATTPSAHGPHGPGVLVPLVLTSLAWMGWVAITQWPVGPGREPLAVLAVTAVLGAAGAVLLGLDLSIYVEAFPCVAVFLVSVELAPRWSVPVLAGIVAAIVAASMAGRTPAGGLAQAVLIPVGVFFMGLNRREFRLRSAEQARTAALAERARIAREIHDVLAHSLAGLTVQLEAARVLLDGHGDPDRALAHVERAHRLSTEGLAETRRAIAALREDTLPLTDLLTALVAEHGDRTGAGATFTVRGTPRPLRADVSLTLYRAAQEALTNAFRHARGAAVEAELSYGPREAVLTITDSGPDGAGPGLAGADRAGPPPPAAAASGGYGLTGMRERAELAGGTLRAGPWGNGWRVELRVPA